MAPGETLEVVADGMCTTSSLPDAVALLGHKMLKTEAIGNGLFKYTIQANQVKK